MWIFVYVRGLFYYVITYHVVIWLNSIYLQKAKTSVCEMGQDCIGWVGRLGGLHLASGRCIGGPGGAAWPVSFHLMGQGEKINK